MLKKIGIMQGRLSLPLGKKIQAFPSSTWKNEFEIANKLSIKFIEWTLDYKNLSKNPLLLSSGQKKIKKLSKKYKVKVNSITGDCFMQRPFWKARKSYKKKLLLDLKKIISSASKLKIKFLVIPLVDQGSIKNYNQKKILVHELKKIKNFLKKKRVKILFETDLNPQQNFEFLKDFDTKLFGLNYDIGNSASLDYDPSKEFKKNFSKIDNIHIKDRKKFGGTVPLGNGNAKFNLISKLCKRYNYKGNFIIQAARKKKGEEIETIKTYLEFLKKKFI